MVQLITFQYREWVRATLHNYKKRLITECKLCRYLLWFSRSVGRHTHICVVVLTSGVPRFTVTLSLHYLANYTRPRCKDIFISTIRLLELVKISLKRTQMRRNDTRSLHPHPVSWHQLQRSAARSQCSDVPDKRPTVAPFCSEFFYSPVNQITSALASTRCCGNFAHKLSHLQGGSSTGVACIGSTEDKIRDKTRKF